MEVTAVLTNAVVANCVVLVNAGAVNAVGVPVKEGEAMVALNKISAVFQETVNYMMRRGRAIVVFKK
jgi:hypothetical protein